MQPSDRSARPRLSLQDRRHNLRGLGGSPASCVHQPFPSSLFPPSRPVHFAVVATLRTGTGAGSFASDRVRARVSVRAAKPAPKANRITGPKLLAAAPPAK